MELKQACAEGHWTANIQWSPSPAEWELLNSCQHDPQEKVNSRRPENSLAITQKHPPP